MNHRFLNQGTLRWYSNANFIEEHVTDNLLKTLYKNMKNWKKFLETLAGN